MGFPEYNIIRATPIFINYFVMTFFDLTFFHLYYTFYLSEGQRSLI